MSKYKVIIFDLDGTAMPNIPNGMPGTELIKTIQAAKAHIKLCAATGRPITNAKPILDVLGLSEPCVISAGTQIVNPSTSEILWKVNIEPKDVQKILDTCRPFGYELLINNELMSGGTTASERIIVTDVNVMYLMGCSSSDADVLLARLAAIKTITAAGVTSWTHEGVDIHITHSEATKEHAIAQLLKILDVKKQDSIGVGDANNDVHLFKAVGHKVAMGNGTDLLKSQADEICASAENDGLANIIKKYS